MLVPTVVDPGVNAGATAATVATTRGVASTGTSPDRSATAVSASVTVSSTVADSPGASSMPAAYGLSVDAHPYRVASVPVIGRGPISTLRYRPDREGGRLTSRP